MEKLERIRVIADPDLADLIPGFLENRARDVQLLRNAVAAGDYQAARFLGHSLKGSGGGYGFDGISAIGAEIETAAKTEDAAAVSCLAGCLEDYLQRVEVTYE